MCVCVCVCACVRACVCQNERERGWYRFSLNPQIYTNVADMISYLQMQINHVSPVENKNDLELDFKVFFFTDSCCSDIVHDESN